MDLLHLCAINQQKKPVEYAYKLIKEKKMRFGFGDKMNVSATFVYGKIYNTLKNIYKAIFFRR